MSSEKIELYFDQDIDPDLENKIRGKGHIIRLYCDVMFRTQNGWTEPYTAIVDSGAHISVIPRRIWSKSKVNIIQLKILHHPF
ncbi:MAG: hypothetical protein ACE5KT_12665 [Methanosarcinales archaeon]